ncbi:MAG: methylated-DNA--[protein]-cysteine S-methyltransferase [Halobacteriales archaeon]
MQFEVLGAVVDIDLDVVDASPEEVRRQLHAYERGERHTFDVGVHPRPGFTGVVMAALAGIPYGETRSYGDIAETLDTAPIAVGRACGRNPAPVVVPCHRVVRSDGALGGYSAPGGIELKRRLIEHEARRVAAAAGVVRASF